MQDLIAVLHNICTRALASIFYPYFVKCHTQILWASFFLENNPIFVLYWVSNEGQKYKSTKSSQNLTKKIQTSLSSNCQWTISDSGHEWSAQCAAYQIGDKSFRLWAVLEVHTVLHFHATLCMSDVNCKVSLEALCILSIKIFHKDLTSR